MPADAAVGLAGSAGTGLGHQHPRVFESKISPRGVARPLATTWIVLLVCMPGAAAAIDGCSIAVANAVVSTVSWTRRCTVPHPLPP